MIVIYRPQPIITIILLPNAAQHKILWALTFMPVVTIVHNGDRDS